MKEHEELQQGEGTEPKIQARGSGSAMELRKVRKATAKKRVLDDQAAGQNQPHSKSARIVQKRSKKKADDDDDDDDDQEEREEEAEEQGIAGSEEEEEGEGEGQKEMVDNEEDKEEEEIDDDESSQLNDSSESGTMTLQQFTDIVLASEGLSVSAQHGKQITKATKVALARRELDQNEGLERKRRPVILENNNTVLKVKEEEEENNNGEVTAASLMRKNNELIVEVKSSPAGVAKPVVLSPRQPPGAHVLPGYYYSKNPRLASSVVVSVKPRVNPPPRPTPPQNRPPNAPRLVEEWLSKIPKHEDSAVLNLSTKSNPPVSRTTQVYLRPIPTTPRLSFGCSRSDSSTSVTLLPKKQQQPQQQQPQQQQVQQLPAVRSLGDATSPAAVSAAQKSPISSCGSSNHSGSNKGGGGLSPPRLEITRVDPSQTQTPSSKKVGRAEPFEASRALHMDVVRARALRDVQLAHTKDMHGNFPIHMSVLMRRPELVRRYCCILQVLESSIDLLNEDKMTPLHLAIRDSSLEIMDVLLNFGADVSITDRRGNSALHMAAAAKSAEMVRKLVANAKPKALNAVNDYGLTPLHIATMNGDSAVAEILTKHGADPGIPDGLHGLTPASLDKRGKSTNGLFELPKKTHVEIQSR